jgi:hypothetical protein
MSREDLTLRRYVPTEPYDSADPPRFSQLIETTKDAFASELKQFFTYVLSSSTDLDTRYRLSELPTIQKYAQGTNIPFSTDGDLETVAKTMMSYADSADKFPMIAITSVSLRERRLGIGNNFVDHVQEAPRVEGTKSGPFALSDGWMLELETVPWGLPENTTTTTLTMASVLFSDISDASIDDVVKAINAQALLVTASATSGGCLRLSCGGPCAPTTPNTIEVTGGTAACLSALGLTVGQSDTYLNTARPPKNRYGLMGDLTVNLDVITDDLNERNEMSDLVQNFFMFWMEKRRFQLIGRSYQEEGISPEEWYHVIFKGDFSWNGEINIPRLGGEVYDYIYANRGSINVTSIDYIDRPLTVTPIFLQSSDVVYDSTLPTGDYTGRNFFKNR